MARPAIINRAIIAACIAGCAAVTFCKVALLDYRPSQVVPRQAWDVGVTTTANGYGADFTVTHAIPSSELGQKVETERIDGSFTSYSIDEKNQNRAVTFRFRQLFGQVQTSYAFRVRSQNVVYKLPAHLLYPPVLPGDMAVYLEATDAIQKDDPVIAGKARDLGLGSLENSIDIVQRIFRYVHTGITPVRFSGETDAVLTCKLGEASCNGKSRLMVALCRHLGIPARLVGGIILQGDSKRTSHQWVEVFLGESWVPFCPLNGYSGVKPRTYVVFYRGDRAMFRHTKDIGFDYRYAVTPTLVPRDERFQGHKLLDIVSIWKLFQKAGIPLETLGIILVIPLGALVTIIFRNVMGVQTFGTFLPALIAYAFMGTGLWWGMLIFVSIITAGALIDWAVSRLRLLHTPRLTVIMVFVVTALIAFGVAGIRAGNLDLARSFFFPLAIQTITIERFFVVAQERSLRASFAMLAWSMVVVAFCYMVMSSLILQMIVVFYPEVYLLVIAATLYIGRWTGLRVSEFFRFRGLILSGR